MCHAWKLTFPHRQGKNPMHISLKGSEGQAFSNTKLFGVQNAPVVLKVNILDRELYVTAVALN